MSRKRKMKVRRFGQLYSPRRSTPAIVVRTVLTIIVMCVMGFVGWNAYGPIRDYFSGALAVSRHQQAEEAVSSVPEPVDEAPQAPQVPQALRAAYFPVSMLADDMLLDTVLSQLAGTDINAILFDLKDASGRVYYRSDEPRVEQARAQADPALDLARFCARLEENGLTAVGRLSVFADPLASVYLNGAGVRYMDADVIWLDDYQENGGKGWLNPYAEEARSYITALISEASSKGVGRIVLDHYSFPMGVGLEFANFGEAAGTIPRETILASSFKAFTEAAQAHDAALSLYVSGTAALGADNGFYGDRNPLTYSGDVVVGVMPAQFGDLYENGAFRLEAPVQHPYETVKSLLEQLSPALADKDVTAMLQGDTATGTLESNKVYTWEDIEAQRRALEESGVESYFLYSPNGGYPAAETGKDDSNGL